MGPFHKYTRKGFAEARELEEGEGLDELRAKGVSVSRADAESFASEPPGMVFRNAENHEDQWYVARAFFEVNYNTQPAD